MITQAGPYYICYCTTKFLGKNNLAIHLEESTMCRNRCIIDLLEVSLENLAPITNITITSAKVVISSYETINPNSLSNRLNSLLKYKILRRKKPKQSMSLF